MSVLVDQLLFRELCTALAPRRDIRTALVFGSRARGTEHAASDLDLGIDGAGVDLLALAGELSSALGVTVDA